MLLITLDRFETQQDDFETKIVQLPAQLLLLARARAMRLKLLKEETKRM